MKRLLHVCLAVLVAMSASAQVSASSVEREIAAVVSGLSTPVQLAGRPAQTMPLDERMAFYKTPGASIAYFREGKILWARGFGVTEANGSRPITPSTLFQAASISKALAAMTALSLVEDKVFDLDADIRQYLGDWRIPDNEFTKNSPPTLRQLLSHTAGFSVPGFAGYKRGAALPTILQVLNGEPPANNEPVRIMHQPGSEVAYSGGGYVVLQHMIEHATGRRFADIVGDRVLQPLNLANSGYYMDRRPKLQASGFAQGHDGDGLAFDGGYIVYPEASPAGLWSTPSDLAKIALEVQRSFAGESSRILSTRMTREMLKRQKGNWALGWEFISREDPAPWFYASGSNRGYKSFLYARMDGSQGVAIMTNSDNGASLFGEILAGMALIYEWNELKPEERTAIDMSSDALAIYAGSYAFSQPIEGVLIVKAFTDNITLEIPGIAAASTFYPQSKEEFFDLGGNTARFGFDRAGAPVTLAIGDVVGKRK